MWMSLHAVSGVVDVISCSVWYGGDHYTQFVVWWMSLHSLRYGGCHFIVCGRVDVITHSLWCGGCHYTM